MRRLARLAEDRGAGRRRRCRAHSAANDASVALALAALVEALEGVLAEQRVEAEPRLRVGRRRAAGGAARPGSGSCRRATRGRRRRRRRGRPRRSRPAAAVSAVQPPANTPSRANRRRSASASSSSLQAIAPRRVRCRSGRSRLPPRRSRLCSRRSQDLRGRQHADPRRGELERQRQAAEALGDRADGVHRVVAQDEAGPVLARAVDEQRDAGVDLQRRDGMTALAADPQQLAAGDDAAAARRRRGRAARRSRRRRGAAARGCRGRAGRSGRGDAPRSASSTGCSDDSRTPIAAAIVGSMRAGSRIAARSTNQVPCGNAVADVARDRQREPGLAAAVRARSA